MFFIQKAVCVCSSYRKLIRCSCSSSIKLTTGGVCDLCPVFLVRLDIHRSSYGFLRINFHELGDFLEDVEETRRNYKVCFEKKDLMACPEDFTRVLFCGFYQGACKRQTWSSFWTPRPPSERTTSASWRTS